MTPEGGNRTRAYPEGPPAGSLGRLKQALTAAGTRTPAPHRPRLSSSIMAALVAIGVVLGFVVVRSVTHNDTARSSASSTTTVPPSTTTTGVQHSVPPPVPSTTTTTPPKQATSPPPSTTSSLCTPSDLTVSAASDAGSYSPGQVVQVTTEVNDVVACTFHPQGAGSYPCPSNVVVVESGGGQVWPVPGQGEQCSPPANQVLEPGDQVTLRAAWNEQVATTAGGTEQAPAGNYQVLGTWSWAAGSGQGPYQVQAYSGTFYVS